VKTCKGSRRLDYDLADMAKKVFQRRLNASLCAVYEDISEDEFDPTEIQLAEQRKPVSYYTSFNPLYSFYGPGSIQIQQSYLAATPVFTTSFDPPPYIPVETTKDVDGWQKTNKYDNYVDNDPPIFEEDKTRFVVKKEPEEDDLEEESTVSDETDQQLIDEYIKTELEEEYSEVEHSECEDIVANDAIVKDEPIVKEEEDGNPQDITDKYVKKETDSEQEQLDHLSGVLSNKIFDQFYLVPENPVSEHKTSETVNEKLLSGWSDISEDESLDGVTNDKSGRVESDKITHLKVNRNLFPNVPNINQEAINLREKAEPENIVQENRHFVHSSECDCNGHGDFGSSYDNLFQRIPNVSYKASNYREKKIFSKDDLTQEKSNVSFKRQNGPELSEIKISYSNGESRIDEHGSSSDKDNFQMPDLGDEPPKKREKLASYSSTEKFKFSETICSPSRDKFETTDDNISSFSYPTMPYFFEEQKDILADPLKNEVTPSKSSPGKIRAHHLKLLNCPLCTRKYWKESKLKEHMKMHHAEKKIKKEETDRRYEISRCPECKEQLHTKVEMYVHRLTHLIPEFKKVKCPFCDNNQYSFDGLKEHVKSVHNLKDKWFCPICPVARTFTHRNSLLVHISTYHFDPAREAPSTFPCSQCSKVFSSKALLGKHINNNHLGPTVTEMYYKMFKCDICEKSYDKLYDLKKHMKARHMNNQVSGKDEDKTNSDFNEKLKIHNKNLLNKLTPLSGNVVPQ